MTEPEQELPWNFIANNTNRVQNFLWMISPLLYIVVPRVVILPSRSIAEGLALVSSSSEIVVKPTAQTAIIYSHMSIKAQSKRWSGCGDRQGQASSDWKARQKESLINLLWSAFFFQKFLQALYWWSPNCLALGQGESPLLCISL